MNRWRNDRGETLVEGLVAIGIVGVVIVALVAALMFAGSASTLLKAESASKASARSIKQAVSAYRIPSGTPWVVDGHCNGALIALDTGTVPQVVNAAYNSVNASGLIGAPTVRYALMVARPQASGATRVDEVPCGADNENTIAVDSSTGETVIALKVSITVTARGHTTSRDKGGQAVREDATLPSTRTAFLYRGLP